MTDPMMTALQQIGQQLEAIKGEAGSIYAVGDQGQTAMGFTQQLDSTMQQMQEAVRELQNLKMKQEQEQQGVGTMTGEMTGG